MTKRQSLEDIVRTLQWFKWAMTWSLVGLFVFEAMRTIVPTLVLAFLQAK